VDQAQSPRRHQQELAPGGGAARAPGRSRTYPHPIIAREGWPFLAAAVIAAAAVWWAAGGWWSAPLWVAVAFIVQFFRDPPRTIAGDAASVLVPADGRIVAVERAHDPYLDRPATKVSVFMNVFNVHSNRSPVDGEVKRTWYAPGKFVNAALDKASLENERNALWLRADVGPDVTCVQIAGLVARRILCYAKPGDRLHRGDRFGFIRFGSRVDVYLPLEARVLVELGQRVYAASTVLAEL
jgi:phosphatidylserine decarboxylase